MIVFLEYAVTGFWWFLWFLFFVITGFFFLGIVGNKQAIKKQARIIEQRKEIAKNEAKKALDQIDKNAEFGGVDMNLDPDALKAEQEAKKEASKNIESSVSVQTNGDINTVTVIDNTKPITEEDAKKDDVPSVLVINDDGTSN